MSRTNALLVILGMVTAVFSGVYAMMTMPLGMLETFAMIFGGAAIIFLMVLIYKALRS